MEEMNEVTLADSIVATSELSPNDVAIAELEQRVREIEMAISDLRTVKAEGISYGRKTVVTASIVAKGDVYAAVPVDEALQSLSVEQRIAVKSGLMRAGLL
jgi:translation elongation factor EF-1beta